MVKFDVDGVGLVAERVVAPLNAAVKYGPFEIGNLLVDVFPFKGKGVVAGGVTFRVRLRGTDHRARFYHVTADRGPGVVAVDGGVRVAE